MSSAIATIQPQQVERSYAELMRPGSLDEAIMLAEKLATSAFVPKEFRGKPGDVLASIMFGAELGVGPLQAMQNIAVINGKPSIWGDLALALVQSHSHYEWHKEWFEGKDATLVAVFQIKRRGSPVHEVRFGHADAHAAGLLAKGLYKTHKPRMFQMRARGFGLRDQFSDALKGLITREEAEDYSTAEPTRAEVITQAPQAEPVTTTPDASEPAKTAVEKTKEQLKRKSGAGKLGAVLKRIDEATSLEELNAVADDARKLKGDELISAREAFAKRKADIEFADEPPHDADGVVTDEQSDGDTEEREPGAD
jgi:hypothetical protein